MRINRRILASIFVMPLIGAKSPAPPPLEVGPDQIVSATVNGQPARLRMMGSGFGLTVLNRDYAARLGLKPGMLSGKAIIGPVKIKLPTSVVQIGVQSAPARRRIAWSDHDYAPGTDGGTAPGAVPQNSVIFRLRAQRPGESEFALPMQPSKRAGGTFMTPVTIAGKQVEVWLDPASAETMATAAAAAALSAANGAQLTGAAHQHVAWFDVSRPVRVLRLGSPLTLGSLRLRETLALTGDFSDGKPIADADLDPNEIVVTAKGSKVRPAYIIRVGRDALSACSSVKFDKAARQIRLSCSNG